jgi:hypothetical protein
MNVTCGAGGIAGRRRWGGRGRFPDWFELILGPLALKLIRVRVDCCWFGGKRPVADLKGARHTFECTGLVLVSREVKRQRRRARRSRYTKRKGRRTHIRCLYRRCSPSLRVSYTHRKSVSLPWEPPSQTKLSVRFFWSPERRNTYVRHQKVFSAAMIRHAQVPIYGRPIRDSPRYMSREKLREVQVAEGSDF